MLFRNSNQTKKNYYLIASSFVKGHNERLKQTLQITNIL